MYNRYIPQGDGSFQRKSAPDQIRKPPEPKTDRAPNPPTPPVPQPITPAHQAKPAAIFLRNLLPREFDTGDLIVVLLLLLMAGDSEQERNNALLTLALYFFL